MPAEPTTKPGIADATSAQGSKWLLISPRIAVQKGDFLGSGIPYWPVELAVLAAFLRERGDGVKVWDSLGSASADFEARGDHYLQGRSLRCWMAADGSSLDCDAVIIYAMSYMSHQDILASIRALRARPSTKTIAVLENSQAVTAYALPEVRHAFFEAGADILICGEAYWNWDEIRAALANPHSQPPSNCISRGSAASTNPVERRIKLGDAHYPIPAWELFDLEGYWSLPYAHGPKTPRFLPILTSRGCPYPCDFCVVPETNGRKWRPRPAADVVEEIVTLRDRTGVRDFQVEDLNPTVSSARWRDISKRLVEMDAGVRYYLVSGTKAETLKLEDMELYARSGCRYISISPESGSAAVMKSVGKPFDYDHGCEVVKLAHKNNIRTQACFIVGHPAEEEKDHLLSRKYLRKLVRAGLDEAAIFIVAPLSGSRLQREARIPIADGTAMISFSPRGRKDWEVLVRRRRQLITDFFIGKLWSGSSLAGNIFRSLAGCPETKMENLWRRVIFVLWHTTLCRLRPQND